ncbi:Carbon-nitrogen hydrolase [Gonapodya sp. JEL0774]|nr:Carbon-nitrogen hydrolase [Gonapodya sp. JEL0774]
MRDSLNLAKALLQFNPKLADRAKNIQRATELIRGIEHVPDVDIVLGPEMAFSGYVFRSKEDIQPMLEGADEGPSVQWAMKTATLLNAHVQIGFPQLTAHSSGRNSVVIVCPPTHSDHSGAPNTRAARIARVYSKVHLYETDENWANEGEAFWAGEVEGLHGTVGAGICMDVNPWRFTAPFTAYEFANFHVAQGTTLLLLSMAWLLSRPDESATLITRRTPEENEKSRTQTLNYWVARLAPLVDATSGGGREVVVAVANRTGNEEGVTFCGCSCVLRFKKGKAYLLGAMGVEEEGVLVVEV